jgi:hypothetical protein
MIDEIILNFIKDNLVTIGITLAVLKEIARETPWAADDKIFQILTGLVSRFWAKK